MDSILRRLENVPLTRLLVIAFAVILLCCISAIAIISLYFADRIMSSMSEQSARHSAQSLQTRTGHFLGIADRTIRNTALSLQAGRTRIDRPETLSRFLWEQTINADSALKSDIHVVSASGHFMSSRLSYPQDGDPYPTVISGGPDTDFIGLERALRENGTLGSTLRKLDKQDPRNTAWYRQAIMANGAPVWSDADSAADTGRRLPIRSVSVLDDNGTLAGVVALNLSWRHLDHFLKTLVFDEGGSVFLFDGNHQLLGASEMIKLDPAASIQRDNTNPDPRIRTALDALAGSSAAHGVDDEPLPSLVSSSDTDDHLFIIPIGSELGADWRMVAFLPSTGFLASAGKETTLLLALTVAVLLVGSALTLVFVQLIVKPLKSLTSDARQVAAGQFSLPIKNDAANEVGELSRSIDDMRQKLKTSISHLRDANGLLKRENNRIETTLSSLDDGVITFGVDGTIQFMNKAAERKTGWTIGKVRGCTVEDVRKSGSATDTTAVLRFHEAIRQAMKGYDRLSRSTITTLHQDDSGASISCRLTALTDRREAPQGAVLVFNELSELLELKLRHEKTIADHRQLSHLVEETDHEVYVVEPATFRITMMNKTARTNLGYNKADAEKLTLRETIIDFEKTFPLELLDGVSINRLSGTVVETTHRRKDGSQYPTETRLYYVPDETPPYFALIAQDTTERRRRMQDLLLRDRAIEVLDVGVFILSQESGCLLYANTAMTTITGYQTAELIGRGPEVFIGSTYADGPEYQPWSTRAPQPLHQYNLTCYRKNSSSYAAELSLSYIRDNSGKATHCIGIVEDVTSRISAEESLRQAQKFDAIGRLSGGVAHDFNNLLNIISGRLEFLSNAVEDKVQRLHIAEAESAAEMGARLTRRLLAFARRSPLEPSVVNLNRLVIEALSVLKASLTGRVSVTSDLDADLWDVRTDRSEIENAVINLAINARDAMPRGGTIRIRTCNATISTPARQRLNVSPGDYVCLSVTDTGNGIDRETLSRMFEPFFTTKEPGKGTGLGLASLFGFTRQSGGDVIAESTLGSGTSISLYLPRHVQTGTESIAPSTPPVTKAHTSHRQHLRENLKRRNLSVLIVDDNQQVLKLTEARMTGLGMRVTSIGSGAQAFDHIRAGHHHDMLFCDVALEDGISGYEVAEKMLQADSRCRILLTSGFSESMLSDDFQSDFPVLQKPYGVDALAAAIIQLFDSEASAIS